MGKYALKTRPLKRKARLQFLGPFFACGWLTLCQPVLIHRTVEAKEAQFGMLCQIDSTTYSLDHFSTSRQRL